MANDQLRVDVATLLRGIGHEFVARDLGDDQLATIHDQLLGVLHAVRSGTPRERRVPRGSLASFKLIVPEEGTVARHQLFSDSVVSGGANPMGLGAYLWRDGDDAVMEVTLGKAFEGAPGRAHGGIVAALIDETMGLVLAINDQLAFTAQLNITFVAPTPIDEPITARAHMAGRDGRKLSIDATVQAGSEVIARATALFISVDPLKFLEYISVPDQ